ncbi:hypothetical protein M231_02007 [Tremella mesenterica]|uniref:Uncharacterized protein n=1 Tax=Tremella mesenterica TaxID=5217 RepID=A0A4Q1BRZ7_TREME|nr:hypothetical protein M231_02007 [Tremella mesenterica]
MPSRIRQVFSRKSPSSMECKAQLTSPLPVPTCPKRSAKPLQATVGPTQLRSVINPKLCHSRPITPPREFEVIYDPCNFVSCESTSSIRQSTSPSSSLSQSPIFGPCELSDSTESLTPVDHTPSLVQFSCDTPRSLPLTRGTSSSSGSSSSSISSPYLFTPRNTDETFPTPLIFFPSDSPTEFDSFNTITEHNKSQYLIDQSEKEINFLMNPFLVENMQELYRPISTLSTGSSFHDSEPLLSPAIDFVRRSSFSSINSFASDSSPGPNPLGLNIPSTPTYSSSPLGPGTPTTPLRGSSPHNTVKSTFTYGTTPPGIKTFTDRTQALNLNIDSPTISSVKSFSFNSTPMKVSNRLANLRPAGLVLPKNIGIGSGGLKSPRIRKRSPRNHQHLPILSRPPPSPTMRSRLGISPVSEVEDWRIGGRRLSAVMENIE